MPEQFIIETATRQQAPVSVFIEGESGAGKTYSALLLARGLVGPGEKIGVIDTEGGRSLIYADDPDIGGFEHMDFRNPYSPERFIAAMQAGVAAGWKALLIDSASLEHDGEGGLLDMAEEEDARLTARNPQNKGISQQKWTKPKLAHKRFLNSATGLPCHVIMCFRQTLTTDFESKPPKTILTTVAEKNTKFALELHVHISADHKAHWSRIPKPYLPCINQDAPISVETGRLLANSANVGVPRKAPPVETVIDDSDREMAIADISDYLSSEGISIEAFNATVESAYKGKYKDYRDLRTDHLLALSQNDKLTKMGEMAKEVMERSVA